jgi:hypothetical protein
MASRTSLLVQVLPQQAAHALGEADDLGTVVVGEVVEVAPVLGLRLVGVALLGDPALDEGLDGRGPARAREAGDEDVVAGPVHR